MTSSNFRNAYDVARAAGFPGTRSEFATLVLHAPSLFRGAVVAAARRWEEERSAPLLADSAQPPRRAGLTLLHVADGR